jgi:hypothetical protein
MFVMPPITGDPSIDGFNLGYAWGVVVGTGSTMLVCLVLALLGVFA